MAILASVLCSEGLEPPTSPHGMGWGSCGDKGSMGTSECEMLLCCFPSAFPQSSSTSL